jgi:hypothetical protein
MPIKTPSTDLSTTLLTLVSETYSTGGEAMRLAVMSILVGMSTRASEEEKRLLRRLGRRVVTIPAVRHG